MAIRPEATSSPSEITRETESATFIANSYRLSLDHRLAKNGIEATPAACANTAIGAVKSRFAYVISEIAPSVLEANLEMIQLSAVISDTPMMSGKERRTHSRKPSSCQSRMGR